MRVSVCVCVPASVCLSVPVCVRESDSVCLCACVYVCACLGACQESYICVWTDAYTCTVKREFDARKVDATVKMI